MQGMPQALLGSFCLPQLSPAQQRPAVSHAHIVASCLSHLPDKSPFSVASCTKHAPNVTTIHELFILSVFFFSDPVNTIQTPLEGLKDAF